jgi:hypothetical protein
VGAKNAKVGKEYSAGKSYVVFGKQDNTNTIDLSDIAYGIGGFVINGEPSKPQTHNQNQKTTKKHHIYDKIL